MAILVNCPEQKADCMDRFAAHDSHFHSTSAPQDRDCEHRGSFSGKKLGHLPVGQQASHTLGRDGGQASWDHLEKELLKVLLQYPALATFEPNKDFFAIESGRRWRRCACSVLRGNLKQCPKFRRRRRFDQRLCRFSARPYSDCCNLHLPPCRPSCDDDDRPSC